MAATEREARSIPTNEFLGLRRQFERQFCELRDEEVPSRNSLEHLTEPLESGDWRAMSLKEIASKADVETDSQWASLTVGKLGQVRLKKSSVETAAPKDLGEYRQKLKLLRHHFVFLRIMQPNRRELVYVTPFTFSAYSDYMLSKRVAKLASEDENGQVFHQPILKQVLTYDFDVRKKMVELLQPASPMGSSLKAAMECSVTKERYFTTPVSVSAAAQASRSRSPAIPSSSGLVGKEPRAARAIPRKERAKGPTTRSPPKGGKSAMPTIRPRRGVTALAAGFIVARYALDRIQPTSTPHRAPLRPGQPSPRVTPGAKGRLDSQPCPGCGSCIFTGDRAAKLAWALYSKGFARNTNSTLKSGTSCDRKITTSLRRDDTPRTSDAGESRKFFIYC